MREHVATNLDAKKRSDDNSIFIDVSETRTDQSFVKDCDIASIMAKFIKTGVIDHTNRYQGDYSDFGDSQDYHASLNAVLAADDMFMSLPAEVRIKFDNNPGRFLDFVDDPKNMDEMVQMGLAVPREAPVKEFVESSDSGVKGGS